MILEQHYCRQIGIDQAIIQGVLQTHANKPAENVKCIDKILYNFQNITFK